MEKSTPGPRRLSGRQAEIAVLVARGDSNRDIARALRLSMRTVDGHVVAIYNKLGVRSRVELTALLLRPDPERDAPTTGSRNAKTNLAFPRTTLIGREREYGDIARLVRAHRLVTVTGTGGVGKTTMATASGLALLDSEDAEAWLVDLAPLPNGSFVPATVARTFGVRDSVAGGSLDRLIALLNDRALLLILDNCEHVISQAAALADTLLARCEHLRILATSREPLQIAGEFTYRLSPLSVPSEHAVSSLDVEGASHFSAMTLFSERARAVDRTFVLNADNVSSVAQICRRLDGVPLAIELAAARVNVLTPHAVARSLERRFHAFPPNHREGIARHRTLRSLIDWSYDLLNESEQSLFRRLGTFVNGFTLEGAVMLGSGAPLGEMDAANHLASLVDKSLVQTEQHGETLRFRLLESTREYARIRLLEASEGASSSTQHARYMRDRFVVARRQFESTAMWTELDNALAIELEDVRAALDWAIENEQAVLGGQLLAAIGGRWSTLGLEHEATLRLESYAAVISSADAALLAILWTEIANNYGASGRTTQCLEAATTALDLARTSSDDRTLAKALQMFAVCNARSGRLGDSENALDEAEAFQNLSVGLRLQMLSCRAMLSGASGDHARSIRAYEQLLSEHRALHNAPAVRSEIANLAEAEHVGGRTQRAVGLLLEALPRARASNDRYMLVTMLANLAGYFASLDKCYEAASAAREAIREAAAHDALRTSAAMAVEHLALALLLGGEKQRAATLSGYADAALSQHGFIRGFTETVTRERLESLLRETVPAELLERQIVEGAKLTATAASALALEEA